ncbi:hypothetical protein TeGR_g7953 [Tetraparma gracilis]|uniref:Uncharacterized protein n=1 Tax=Tetraparma gracilis TaxID=2962635 RepID=A0ABQ6MYG4_9STRA|nr:hypothetical protein TeGR_g7953 [Tetraparma gracilis]
MCRRGSLWLGGFAPFSGSCTSCPDDAPFSPPAATSVDQCVAPPCDVGSYSETGRGPSCTQCQATLAKSPIGSTSQSDCFGFGNIYAVSPATDRVMGFNYQEQQFDLVKEGGSLDYPTSVVFIDATTYLVCNYDAGNVVMEDVNGTTIRVVAEIGGASGLLIVPGSRQLGVANWDRSSVLFFDEIQYGSRSGDVLTAADAVGEVVSAAFEAAPDEVVMGVTTSEIYVRTYDDDVWRFCLESADCRPAQRNAKMLNGNGLVGLAVLKSLSVYLVSKGDKILSCPTSVTNNYWINCDVFAFEPDNGALWDPRGLLADDTIEVVYVADSLYSTVHALAYDGT